jgi:hypothetical protein
MEKIKKGYKAGIIVIFLALACVNATVCIDTAYSFKVSSGGNLRNIMMGASREMQDSRKNPAPSSDLRLKKGIDGLTNNDVKNRLNTLLNQYEDASTSEARDTLAREIRSLLEADLSRLLSISFGILNSEQNSIDMGIAIDQRWHTVRMLKQIVLDILVNRPEFFPKAIEYLWRIYGENDPAVSGWLSENRAKFLPAAIEALNKGGLIPEAQEALSKIIKILGDSSPTVPGGLAAATDSGTASASRPDVLNEAFANFVQFGSQEREDFTYTLSQALEQYTEMKLDSNQLIFFIDQLENKGNSRLTICNIVNIIRFGLRNSRDIELTPDKLEILLRYRFDTSKNTNSGAQQIREIDEAINYALENNPVFDLQYVLPLLDSFVKKQGLDYYTTVTADFIKYALENNPVFDLQEAPPLLGSFLQKQGLNFNTVTANLNFLELLGSEKITGLVSCDLPKGLFILPVVRYSPGVLLLQKTDKGIILGQPSLSDETSLGTRLPLPTNLRVALAIHPANILAERREGEHSDTLKTLEQCTLQRRGL